MMRFTAILLKEFRILLRSGRAYWILMALLTLAGGAFYLMWQEAAGGSTLSDRSRLGVEAFQVMSTVQLCVFGLIAMIMTATSLTVERENRTMDLLRCTGLSPWNVLLGKWVSCLGFQVVLALCLLPIMGLVFQLGGVGLGQYLMAAAFLVVAVLTYGMLGLAVSANVRRSSKALFTGIWLLLLINLALPALLTILSLALYRFRAIPFSAIQIGSACFSPVITWVIFMQGGTGGGPAFWGGASLVALHFCFQAVLFVLSASMAWCGLAVREVEASSNAGSPISTSKERWRRRLRWPFYLIDPLRKPQEIKDGQNPVWVKEKRVSGMAKAETVTRMACYGSLFSLFFVGAAFQDIEDTVRIVAQGAMGFMLFFGPALTASCISREREENTMDLLATSLMRPSRVVWGKMRACLRLYLSMALGIMVLPLVIRGIFWQDRLGIVLQSLHVVPFLLAFSALFASVGVYFSARCRKNATAIILTYITIILMLLSPLVLLLAQEGLFAQARWAGHAFGLWTIRAAVCPLICPFYYFYMEDDSFGHIFHDWNSFSTVALHTSLVLALAGFLFRQASAQFAKRS
jgi:ABC-type transport system involved in multi-copper enzyme maturation permease subunit